VKLTPTHGMSIFETQPELLKDECCIDKAEEPEIVDMDEEHYEGQVVQPVQNPGGCGNHVFLLLFCSNTKHTAIYTHRLNWHVAATVLALQ